MIDHIQRIRDEAETKISSAPDTQELDRLRVQYLGKKGLITSLLHQLKELAPEKRREMGAVLNKIKEEFETSLSGRHEQLERRKIETELSQSAPLDLTLPGQYALNLGSIHPVTRIIEESVQCLKRVGFSVVSGPEIETEFFNFEALNTPADHPARDLQDTFYIKSPILLRSHTSPVQIRTMQSRKPPLQVISYGRVYRSDYDQTHTPMFHQIEGIMVDDHVTMAELKGVLHYWVKSLFGSRPLRFRPSFFPFVEPGAEVDMQCIACRGKGCRTCKDSGWLEIGGCGMIHPNVFKSVGYEMERYSGFAFGFGVERIAMLKYGIDDLRSFFENDHRLLEQF
jgi:phenylalanyl-tRNA synthetase alpha chain